MLETWQTARKDSERLAFDSHPGLVLRACPMDPHEKADRLLKVGSRWYHTYASGHRARIMKILETDYMVYVQSPAEGGTPFHTTARSLPEAIARANRWIPGNSTMADWQPEEPGPFA